MDIKSRVAIKKLHAEQIALKAVQSPKHTARLTRSRIAIKWGKEGYKSIYCHWDGYEEGVGNTLRECFNTPKKARELINLGDCSSIFGDKTTKCAGPIPNVKPYHSSRNYNWTKVKPKISKNFDILVELTKDSHGKLLYIFDGKKWHTAWTEDVYSETYGIKELENFIASINKFER